jgi:hypothetical protein
MKADAKQLFLVLLAALTACGGGTQVAGIDRGGVRGGVSVGVVTGFGSVFVNGSRYSTDMALITVDGVATNESGLALGQVVVLEAEISTTQAAATAITADSNVIGPVANLDPVAGSFTALGQTVKVTDGTYFGTVPGDAGLAGLADDDVVRVSGFITSADAISATRVERFTPAGPFEVMGFARDVDTNQQSLRIGGLIVDYSTAGVVQGFPDGQPRDGDVVRVQGGQPGLDDEFIAASLVLRTQALTGNENDEVEIEGLVTAFTSATEFEVGGVRVMTDANTEFSGGQAADLGLDVPVEVDGHIVASGTVLAEQIDLEQPADVRIEADVDAVDEAGGIITVLGVTVRAAGLTDLGRINTGDCVEVGGYESSQNPGEVTATRLEREDDCETTLLRGVVQSVADPQLTILGVTVVTDGATIFPAGSAAAFFAAAPGRVVEAKGVVIGASLLAGSLEFKD